MCERESGSVCERASWSECMCVCVGVDMYVCM